jgi:hypothetical protein
LNKIQVDRKEENVESKKVQRFPDSAFHLIWIYFGQQIMDQLSTTKIKSIYERCNDFGLKSGKNKKKS